MAAGWFLRINGQVVGPMDDQRLAQLAGEGKIDATTEVAKNQNGPWYAAGQVKGLQFATWRPQDNPRLPHWMPTLISLFALVMATAALALPFFSHPLGKGLKGYDFSTPEAAASSITRIQLGRDILAQLDLQDGRRGGTADEVYRTFEVNRVADFGDKKLVFVSYMRKGKKHKELLQFEKDLESKLWMPTYIGAHEVKERDPKLANEMEAWTEEPVDPGRR